MTTIPALLKEAILEQDWSKANSAYELLTGQAISYEQIVDTQLPSDSTKDEPHVAKSKKDEAAVAKAQDDFGGMGAARREPMNLSDRSPGWIDDGSIAAGEMVSKNPSLGVSSPVERNRKPAKKQNSANSEIRIDQSSHLKDK